MLRDQVYSRLGDLSRFNGNYDNAILEYNRCMAIRQEHCKPSDRCVPRMHMDHRRTRRTIADYSLIRCNIPCVIATYFLPISIRNGGLIDSKTRVIFQSLRCPLENRK